MDVSIDICCLCLKEPLIKEPLIDLNSSRPTYFEKITSTLTKLAQVLNDLNDCDFHICKICASNIELIYSFNSKWLDNVRLYSLRGLLRAKRGEEQCYDLETSRKFSEHSNMKVAKVIKKEVEDSSNSMNIPMEIEQVIIKEECIKGINEVSSPDKKSTLQQPKQDFAQVTLISRSNNQEVNSHPDVNASSTTKIELRRKELQNIQEKRKTKLRFTCQEDIWLLRQTLVINPYEDVKKWREVHKHFVKITKKDFTQRAVKDHVDYLIRLFKQNDMVNLRRSGTEEMCREKEQLIQELLNLKEEYKKPTKMKSTKKLGEDLQLQAASTSFGSDVYNIEINSDIELEENSVSYNDFQFQIVEDLQTTEVILDSPGHCSSTLECGDSSTPSQNVLQRNKDKNSTDTILEMVTTQRLKDMEMENRRLALEEKKIDLEERRLAIEENKTKAMIESQAKQNEIMSLLLNNLIKK